MFCLDNLYVYVLLSSLEFEWDEEKNKKNLVKHGVDFADAQYVFNDKFCRIAHDREHSQTEDRWKVIGNIGKILVVSIAYRNKTVRIISARKATKTERSMYYGNDEEQDRYNQTYTTGNY
jgi:uncharacterized DUF497 family protein